MKKNVFFLFLYLLVFQLSSNISFATTCIDAIQIVQSNLPTNQSLVCGSSNDIHNNTILGSQSYLGGLESVYKFTPTSSGSFTISYTGQTWSGIFVFQGCPTSGGTSVGNITSSSSSKNISVVLTSGAEYYIVFDTYPAPAVS